MKTNTKIAVLAMTVLLGACAGPGPRVNISVTMPDGERATIVAHQQAVPDWMLDRGKLALNYIVKGEVGAKQLAAVAETERACRIYTDTVRPSNLVGVVSSGVLYAAAGFIGVGIGSQAFTGAVQSEYATYGAWASGVSGTANGVVTLGGQTYTFENCGREVLGLFPGYEVRVLNKSPY
ncbi:MAG: hypothetical protein WC790_00560 [Candidatus Paceibacterota bacterium]|jgi:hypothetical protein